MSKLYKLREWLDVREASHYLSDALGEPVDTSTILRLALDGYLRLSVSFVNYAAVRCGKVVPLSEATTKAMTLGNGEEATVVTSLNIDGGRFLNLGDKIRFIEGVWDLPMPMIGGERITVERKYQLERWGPQVTRVALDGSFVEGSDGSICQIQSRADKEKYGANAYFPSEELPDDAVLVVRTAALEEFRKTLASQIAEGSKSSNSRAETTYLNIIGALLGLLLGKAPSGKPYSSFANQSAIIDALVSNYPGVEGVKKRTLEEKFARAKVSLGPR